MTMNLYLPFGFYVDEHITLMVSVYGEEEGGIERGRGRGRESPPLKTMQQPDGCLFLHEIKICF